MFREILAYLRQDNPLRQAQTMAYDMLDECSTMFTQAKSRLRQPEVSSPDYDIRAHDKCINKAEREVRRKLVSYLAVNPEHDINTGLILASTIIDMERMGDYTKNVADLSTHYRGILHAGPYEAQLQEIESAVEHSFQTIVPILRDSLMEEARALIGVCKHVEKSCNEVVDSIVSGQVGDMTPSQAAATVLYFRYLKRLAAHLDNIATSVVNSFVRLGFKEKKKAV